MKLIKKTGLFYALLLISTAFNTHKTHAMEPEDVKKVGWVALAGAAIVGGALAFNKFLSYIHSQSSDFNDLSLEMQYYIIDLLAKDSTATSLEEAAHTINSLAQVNHDLNNLINDPDFCLRIIKSLAKQFGCSDETAAKKLQTQEAKRRLKLQLKLQEKLDWLYTIYVKTEDQAKVAIQNLVKQGVDLSFTVKINHGAINEIAGPIWFEFVSYPHIFNGFVAHGINVNQQASNGASVLLYLLYKWAPSNWIMFMPNLLAAGVDPELADNKGVTPLQMIQNDPELSADAKASLIELIQDAIDKKHEKQGK